MYIDSCSEFHITLYSTRICKSRIPWISSDNSAHDNICQVRVCTLTARSTPIFLNVYHDRIERGQRRQFMCMHAYGVSFITIAGKSWTLWKVLKTISLKKTEIKKRKRARPNFKYLFHLNESYMYNILIYWN